MERDDTSRDRLTWRGVILFVAIFLLLYAALAVVAERHVGRAGQESAFQKLLANRGRQVDWIVLGASHALPLAYGDVPARLERRTGQSMLVLADVGAGPVYSAFVARQAVRDVRPASVLYIVDPFAFQARDWNAGRVEDRTLLRRTPLRAITARLMAGMVLREGVAPSALADYLTAFSKLNPPRRFETGGWEGAAAFDRRARPSRHAVQSRIEYLYPEGAGIAQARPALASFTRFVDAMQARGIRVVALRLPLPAHFREALPDTAAFQAELRRRLDARGVPFHDLSAAFDDPALFFDTDHLNREGVDRLFEAHLLPLLAAPVR